MAEKFGVFHWQGAPRPRAKCKLLQWAEEAQCSESGLEADETFDVVVGAEVLYSRASVSERAHRKPDTRCASCWPMFCTQ